MTDRIIITLVAMAAGVAAYLLLQRWQRRRASLATVATGRPTILYFRSDHCAPCAAQGRFLDQLADRLGEGLAVQQIDADFEADIAARFGVFTVPTTLVVDGAGLVRHANYGLADARKLTAQLRHL